MLNSERIQGASARLRVASREVDGFLSTYRAQIEDAGGLELTRVAVATLLNHFQSVLDYWGAEIADRFTGKPGKYWPQFPIAERSDDFRAQIGRFPNLDRRQPNLHRYLESLQPFNNGFNRWLPQLRDLNGPNKHDQLAGQIRLQRGAIDMWAWQGGPPIPGRPPRRQRQFMLEGLKMSITGNGTFIQQWVDLQFVHPEISVAPFLLRVLDGIEEIHADLLVLS